MLCFIFFLIYESNNKNTYLNQFELNPYARF